MGEAFRHPSLKAAPEASLHADQARPQVGEPCFYLAAGPLLTQHDRATPIQTNDVKRVFADYRSRRFQN
jgi:hypothetical protein